MFELLKLLLSALWLLDIAWILVMLIHRSLFFSGFSEDHSVDLLSTSASPSIALPLPASVKSSLGVVEYRSFGKVKDSTCIICLMDLKESHTVRKLGNCSHAFHKDCIDQRIDRCRITCPLCRSHLLPSREVGRKRCD